MASPPTEVEPMEDRPHPPRSALSRVESHRAWPLPTAVEGCTQFYLYYCGHSQKKPRTDHQRSTATPPDTLVLSHLAGPSSALSVATIPPTKKNEWKPNEEEGEGEGEVAITLERRGSPWSPILLCSLKEDALRVLLLPYDATRDLDLRTEELHWQCLTDGERRSSTTPQEALRLIMSPAVNLVAQSPLVKLRKKRKRGEGEGESGDERWRVEDAAAAMETLFGGEQAVYLENWFKGEQIVSRIAWRELWYRLWDNHSFLQLEGMKAICRIGFFFWMREEDISTFFQTHPTASRVMLPLPTRPRSAKQRGILEARNPAFHNSLEPSITHWSYNSTRHCFVKAGHSVDENPFRNLLLDIQLEDLASSSFLESNYVLQGEEVSSSALLSSPSSRASDNFVTFSNGVGSGIQL
ncbi:hypothetical protein QOT17_003377 [Balamuthia mandrillaris]